MRTPQTRVRPGDQLDSDWQLTGALTKYETMPHARPKLVGPKWDETMAGFDSAREIWNMLGHVPIA